jgi:peptide/nickel transport system permease protein
MSMSLAPSALPASPTRGLSRLLTGGLRWLPTTVLAVVVACALLADVIAPYEPNQQDLVNMLSPPSAKHLLGTDALGRDVLSRMIYGSRVSLMVGVSSVAVAMVLGVFVGIVSAMVGGRFGDALMRLADVSLTLPGILIALAVAATVGPSLTNVILIIALLYWAQFARMVRGEALSIRERDYVQAAIACGCGPMRILRLHVLPNLINTVIVLATLEIAAAVLLESTLSFLGVGVPPPTPTWGSMVSEGRAYVELAWWVIAFPGLAIMLTVLAVNLLGDQLRDRLDPKFSRRA